MFYIISRMEANGVYTEPVYYALREQDFTWVRHRGVVLFSPGH